MIRHSCIVLTKAYLSSLSLSANERWKLKNGNKKVYWPSTFGSGALNIFVLWQFLGTFDAFANQRMGFYPSSVLVPGIFFYALK